MLGLYLYTLIICNKSCNMLSILNKLTLQKKRNKSAKLTQNTPVVFVVNSMVMTTLLGVGYSTSRADATNSVFGQFKGHNSGVPGGIWQVIELSRDIMPTNIFTKFDKDRTRAPHVGALYARRMSRSINYWWKLYLSLTSAFICSSADRDQSSYQVQWLSLINFSRYWADTFFA